MSRRYHGRHRMRNKRVDQRGCAVQSRIWYQGIVLSRNRCGRRSLWGRNIRGRSRRGFGRQAFFKAVDEGLERKEKPSQCSGGGVRVRAGARLRSLLFTVVVLLPPTFSALTRDRLRCDNGCICRSDRRRGSMLAVDALGQRWGLAAMRSRGWRFWEGNRRWRSWCEWVGAAMHRVRRCGGSWH